MKKILIGVVGSMVLGAAAPALAADLPARTYTKAPVVVPSPVYDWSGFYIGLNGGGGSAHKCWDLVQIGATPVNEAEGCHDATGGTVGGQIGYRWQAANWVFGVEAQGNWADFKGSNSNDLVLSPDFGDRSKVDGFGLFTGQVGYAFNNILLYAKGGAAVASDKYSIFAIPPNIVPGIGNGAGQTVQSGSETRWGGAVGAGVEFAFAPRWSVAIEYDHLFMGSRNVQLNDVPPFNPTGFDINHISQNVDIGTVRINYGFGGPVVGKY
jgi:outer membrane immunogenic protein